MPAKKGPDGPGADSADEESSPPWQRASVERSLKQARDRARKRSDQFVAAALAILEETGDADFTVQDVVDRSKMSIRTFYAFFAGKDDLLVALHSTILQREVTPRLRARCARESDPLLRIRAYIEVLFELSSLSGPASRALTIFHYRLAEVRPADLEWALQPQLDLVVELVTSALEAGCLQSPLSAERAARQLHQAVLAAVHSRILGMDSGDPVSPEDLWLFCAMGLGVPKADLKGKRRVRRAG